MPFNTEAITGEYIPTFIDERHYQEAQQFVTTSTGTDYPPCTSANLQDLTSPTGYTIPGALDGLHPPVSRRKALDALERFLKDRPPSALQAAARLHRHLPRSLWCADLPFKIFHDLDAAYYHGELACRCRLRWKSSEAELRDHWGEDWDRVYGSARLVAGTEGRTVLITLNAWAMFRTATVVGRREELVGTLMHEMLHAYFWIRCKKSSGHEEHFRKAMEAINGLSQEEIGHTFYV